jgi:hypothetical protein
MSQITVKIVETKGDLKKFIKFPWDVYKGDPYWVPPLIMDRQNILNKKGNPFFEHAEADYFLAYKEGKLVGRIAAIKNDLHNSTHNDKVGFFGFFECFNDQEVANALFDTAKNWLKERGIDTMRGPMNPSTNDDCGMLLEGFDDEPRIMMTYNPKYYLTLCDNYGFKKTKDLVAYSLETEKVRSSAKLKRVAELARERARIKISTLNMKEFNKELEKVKYVYNKAWAPNWGFVPMTEHELDHMAADLKMLVEPRLVLFGEIDGETVGFALVMPDYNQIFKSMNGKMLPFGWVKLLFHKYLPKKMNWVRVITLGLIPDVQKRGLDGVFYWEIVNRAADLGYFKGEASWILEDNEMMNRGAKHVMGGDLYKKYRIYDIAI